MTNIPIQIWKLADYLPSADIAPKCQAMQLCIYEEKPTVVITDGRILVCVQWKDSHELPAEPVNIPCEVVRCVWKFTKGRSPYQTLFEAPNQLVVRYDQGEKFCLTFKPADKFVNWPAIMAEEPGPSTIDFSPQVLGNAMNALADFGCYRLRWTTPADPKKAMHFRGQDEDGILSIHGLVMPLLEEAKSWKVNPGNNLEIVCERTHQVIARFEYGSDCQLACAAPRMIDLLKNALDFIPPVSQAGVPTLIKELIAAVEGKP